MNVPQTFEHITVEDYLAGEDGSDIRHEYVGGQIYAMTGASVQHNAIAVNLLTAIAPYVHNKNCRIFMSDVKLRLELSGDDVFYYPDLMICCDPTDDHTYYRTKPCLVVEILSPSTERIDRREKRFAYAQIESLKGYLLLAQDNRTAILYQRANDWQAEYHTKPEQEIDLPCVTKTFRLSTFYEGL